MKWKLPPRIKIYEALWAVADDRIYVEWFFSNEWKCYSSSGNKYYTIKYDKKQNAIMTNDNWSFRQGYLWYPAIAFLMKVGDIQYSKQYSEVLKNIKWKDINQEFKNDFSKTEEHILKILEEKGVSLPWFLEEIAAIYKQIEWLHLEILGRKVQPPTWY